MCGRKISFNLSLMKIIAISNLKGGCAKTTTTVNLAACLAELAKKVLVIDLDPQGNASQWLSLENDSNLSSLDLFSGKQKIEALVQSSVIENVDLISASPDLSSLEKLLAGEFAIENILKRRLSQLQSSVWDFVLIDTPPTLGLVTVNALVAAEQLIIPVSTHVLTLAGVAQLMGVIEKIKATLNPNLNILGFLASRVDLRTRHSKEVLETLNEHFDGRVFVSHIRENVKLAEAPSYKKPIISYDANGGAAKDFRGFTKEMLSRVGI